MRAPWREDPFDDELRDAFDATAAEFSDALKAHLMPALRRVRDRGTPLRGVQNYGSDGAVRLRFADGSAFLVRAHGRNRLSMAALAMLRGVAVLMVKVTADGPGIIAVLGWQGEHWAECEILGEDQAD